MDQAWYDEQQQLRAMQAEIRRRGQQRIARAVGGILLTIHRQVNNTGSMARNRRRGNAETYLSTQNLRSFR